MRTLGLDIGGSNLKAAVLEGREVVHSIRESLPRSGAIEAALRVSTELAERHGAVAVGVGFAGLVRLPDGVFVFGPHLDGREVPVLDLFSARLEMPVIVDNDANLAARAELILGAAVGIDHAVIITVGTGIGAALVVGGRVHRGRAFAGEPGHVTAEPDGLICACGRRGCWETVVSGSRLDEVARRLAVAMPRGAVATAAAGSVAEAVHLVDAADAGDEAAIEALEEAGANLGRLIAHLVSILDPEVVVVGGGVAGAGRWLGGPAAEACSTHLHGAAYRDPVDIRFSNLSGMAGAIGAALAAQESVRA